MFVQQGRSVRVMLVLGGAVAALLALAPAPGAAGPEKMSQGRREQFLVLPVQVTDEMKSRGAPITVGYRTGRAASVQVRVYDPKQSLLLQGDRQTSAADATTVSRVGRWSAARETGRHYVALVVSGDTPAAQAIQDITVFGEPQDVKEARRIAEWEVRPAAGKRGEKFTIHYRLNATSKVTCDYLSVKEADKPHTIQDDGERPANQKRDLPWEANVAEGYYMVRIVAGPVRGRGAPEQKVTVVRIRK